MTGPEQTRKTTRTLLLTATMLAMWSPALNATESCTEDAMVVFDGSGSMSEMGFNQLDEPRIFEARRAMHEAMPRIAPFRRLGLIVYGPGENDACHNIDLRFPPMNSAAGAILDAVDGLSPSGGTPLTSSVQQAAEVLDYRQKPGVVVLITDGKENCGGTPCQLAAQLAVDGMDLTVHVIGFKVRGDYFSWDSQGRTDYQNSTSVASCLADRTGGKYVSAETVDELITALQQTLGCQLISGTGRSGRRNG